jgi:hypothetical protein
MGSPSIDLGIWEWLHTWCHRKYLCTPVRRTSVWPVLSRPDGRSDGDKWLASEVASHGRQPVTIRRERVGRRIGHLDDRDIARLSVALAVVMGLADQPIDRQLRANRRACLTMALCRSQT